MVRRPRFSALAAVAVAAVAAGTVVAAVPASAAKRTPARAITVVIGADGMHVSGPTRQHPGRLHITLTAKDAERDLALVRLRPGYSFEDYRSDVGLLGAVGGMGALRRINRHVHGFGGLSAGVDRTVSMWTQPLAAGKYVLYDFSGSLPRRPHTVVLAGARERHAHPAATAVVKMTDGARFRGATVLPSHGTVLVRNAATDVDAPHVLYLQKVAPGTTRADILSVFRNGGSLSFLRPSAVGTDALGAGKSQLLTYHLPAGTYAELCLYPSLANGGMPTAMAGMVRIVTLVKPGS